MAKTYPTCNAKKKDGTPCQRPIIKATGRCRLHGGNITPGNDFAVKPDGIYAQYLPEHEREAYFKMPVGTVDDELRLMRIRLARCMKGEAEQEAREIAQGEDAALDLESRTDATSTTAGVSVSRTFKKYDYKTIIQQTLGRIESLEKTRAELARLAKGDDATLPAAKPVTYEVVR